MNHYCDNIAVNFLAGEALRQDLKTAIMLDRDHRISRRSAWLQAVAVLG